MKFKNKRQRLIYEALQRLGGSASCRIIAEEAELDVNGVSQTLGCMGSIIRLGNSDSRNGGDWTYHINYQPE